MGKLDGKIALITGGSEGIGFSTAQRFITEGIEHVFITGRRQQTLDEAIKKLGNKNVTGVQGDVTKMTDLDKLYDIIKKEKGRLDILFVNAGIGDLAFLQDVTEEHFDRSFNINVKAVLFTVQKALPIFVDGGSIILNASVGSIKGYPGESVYSASKAAVRSFARCWTVDLKDRHIRVNAISPGLTDTPALGAIAQGEAGELLTNLMATAPISRLGTPDEIAKAVVFLASDDSSYITGIELFVDGGLGQI
ncbi:unnamed protein product [Adineta steineri]|uniref:Dehydrogenase/reductase SDR family member 6 n=3 Tax=Adineta steineri TaxID=433720 RepID=A0A814PN63_9BILA|nr:unnamed protein product [Adineta steineri]CAF3976292.1 unnamed protein product [Adineta steineri]